MISKSTRAFTLAIFLVMALFSVEASAQNVLGGRNIYVRDQAVRLTTGFPDIELAYHMPWDRKIEIVPKARFGFALDMSNSVKYLMGGVDLRYQLRTPKKLSNVARRGKGLNVSLLVSAPLFLTLTNDPTLGLGVLWPGVVATYRVSYNFDVNTGLQIQDTYFSGVGWNVSLNVWGGIEYNLTRKVRLLAHAEFGPSLPPGGGTNFFLRLMTGLAYKL
jgi:hypothetical protein